MAQFNRSRVQYYNDCAAGSRASGSKVTLEIIRGDIRDLERTDSIVNFIDNDNIFGKMGVMQAAGDAVKQEYTEKYVEGSDFTMTSGGDLPYKAIFNVTVFKEPAKFEMALYRALRRANKEEMRSIALPALGDRSKGNSCMKEVYGFGVRVRPHCLHLIDIVADNKQDYDYYCNEITLRGEELPNL